MTKEEFINSLREIAKEYGKTRVGENSYPFFEQVKKAAFSYNAELFFHAFDGYVNNEQAADIIRRQPTLEDMLAAVYYIDHQSGLYTVDELADGTVLCDGDLYDVLEKIFKLLGEPCPRWYDEDEENDDDDYDNEEDE